MTGTETLIEPNVSNEQIVLANMIHSPEFRKRMVGEFKAQDFLAVRHQIIFLIFEKIVEKNLQYHEDTLIIESEGADFGGVQYLHELEEAYSPNVNIDHHVNLLRQDSIKKKLLVDSLPELQKQLVDKNSNLVDLKQKVDVFSALIKQNIDYTEFILENDDLFKRYMRLLEDRATRDFIGFNYTELDQKLTCGAEPGQITVVAGLSGAGKTTFIANLVSRWAFHGVKVLICPLEEGGVRIIDRMVCANAHIPTIGVKKNYKTMDKLSRYKIVSAAKELSKKPLIVYDKSFADFSVLEMLVQKHHPQIIVLDLFEKLSEIRGSMKQEVISANLDLLQRFVQDHNIHAVITAQIRRDKMSEKNKRPTLDFIKNSGKYVEVADLVIGLHREKYFLPEDPMEDIIELIVLKQRDGPAPFRVGYLFDNEYSFIGENRHLEPLSSGGF